MENVLTQLMDVFNWIIRSSAYAVVSIAVIALAQFAGRRRLPARWLYALWLILLVRLVLPFGPESGLSLWNLLPRAVYENGSTASAFPSDILLITDSGKDAMADVPNATASSGDAIKQRSAIPENQRYKSARGVFRHLADGNADNDRGSSREQPTALAFGAKTAECYRPVPAGII